MESEKESERSGDDIRGATEVEKVEGSDLPDANPQVLSKKLANPLAGFTPEQLSSQGETFAAQHGITEDKDVRALRIGAQLAGAENWRTVEGMTDEERSVLEKEEKHAWSNPPKLYLVVLVCSLCATVQGMDETVVNGAQGFYKGQFGIDGDSTRDTWLLGLVNGAPYLVCALLGCWMTHPMNKRSGRRLTIVMCQVLMIISCIWQALTDSWWHLFMARCLLGMGLGPLSATVPMFAAETAPPRLRGALVAQWQIWTAFGIMCGYAADLALFKVADPAWVEGLNWRLMLASAALPAVLCLCLIWTIPESPRWLMSMGRYRAAYHSMCELRFKEIQAGRDLFYADALIKAENTVARKAHVKELFTVRRNRNAFIGSEIVMFMQQFCGINVVAYYSTEIFLNANFDEIMALAASLGFGVVNFLCAMPALWTIDTFGRRNLLLTTFPLMAIFLFWCGFSFLLPEGLTRIAMILSGIYLFGMVYSPGEGPVPFTYSAEAYPLYIRPIGMSCATATTWFFNFLLAVTWPSLQTAFTSTGAFAFYAGWNVAGFLLVLFFLPETKGRTLEELDDVFDVPIKSQMAYGRAQAAWAFRKLTGQTDLGKPMPPRKSGEERTPDFSPATQSEEFRIASTSKLVSEETVV